MNTVSLGPVPLGDGHPAVLAAEIGTFFNQDLGLAFALLEGTAAAGVPIFKTEILHNPDVCLRQGGLDVRYNHAAGAQVEKYRALVERKTVPLADYARLFARCRELKFPFIASVYDFAGIDFLVGEGAVGLKISRHNLTHHPLIAYAARSGLPMILDAGVCYLEELARTVQLAQREGAKGIIINHHPGMQPTPPERQNLRVMQTWKQTFDVPVGLACHHRGEEIVFAAIGLGANFIEKGVVDDNTRAEQDVVSAVNLSDLPAFWQKMKNCSAALGARLPQIEEPRNLNTRRGLIARQAIQSGDKLTLENVDFAWPPLGIRVEDWETVAQRPAQRALAAGEVIGWGDVRFDA